MFICTDRVEVVDYHRCLFALIWQRQLGIYLVYSSLTYATRHSLLDRYSPIIQKTALYVGPQPITDELQQHLLHTARNTMGCILKVQLHCPRHITKKGEKLIFQKVCPRHRSDKLFDAKQNYPRKLFNTFFFLIDDFKDEKLKYGQKHQEKKSNQRFSKRCALRIDLNKKLKPKISRKSGLCGHCFSWKI